MAPLSPLIQNRNVLAEFGVTFRRVQPWAGVPAERRQVTPLIGRTGVLPSSVTTSEGRVFTFGLYKKPASVSALVDLRDQLNDFMTGMLDIQMPDAPDRFMRGVCTKMMPGVMLANPFTNPDADLDIDITCYDAAKYDIEPRIVKVTTTPTAIELGTLPSVGEIWMPGALSTSTSIIVRGPSGIPLDFITFLPVLASGDFVRLNLDRPATITKTTSAGAISARNAEYNWKTGGRWFVLDSADADRDGTARVTLECTQGTMALIYHRTWKS